METPGAAVGAATQAKEQNYPNEIIGDRIEILKGLLFARARKAGVSVFETGIDGYVVSSAVVCREVPDLRALQSCLRQLGVSA